MASCESNWPTVLKSRYGCAGVRRFLHTCPLSRTPGRRDIPNICTKNGRLTRVRVEENENPIVWRTRVTMRRVRHIRRRSAAVERCGPIMIPCARTSYVSVSFGSLRERLLRFRILNLLYNNECPAHPEKSVSLVFTDYPFSYTNCCSTGGTQSVVYAVV